MPRIDVVDEGIIDADPSRVFKALIDEYSGVTSWAMPQVEFRIRDGGGVARKGSVIDVTIHGRRTVKFAGRIIEVAEGKLLRVEYFEGEFLGHGEWSLEPVDGKTKARYRWNVEPNRPLFRVLHSLHLINIGKIHSSVQKEEFKALNHYLTEGQR